jgi:hypothetical protein
MKVPAVETRECAQLKGSRPRRLIRGGWETKYSSIVREEGVPFAKCIEIPSFDEHRENVEWCHFKNIQQFSSRCIRKENLSKIIVTCVITEHRKACGIRQTAGWSAPAASAFVIFSLVQSYGSVSCVCLCDVFHVRHLPREDTE